MNCIQNIIRTELVIYTDIAKENEKEQDVEGGMYEVLTWTNSVLPKYFERYHLLKLILLYSFIESTVSNILLSTKRQTTNQRTNRTNTHTITADQNANLKLSTSKQNYT